MDPTDFKLAAFLNNDGVTALLGGHHQAAIESLSKAVKLLKKEYSKRSSGANTSSTGSSVCTNLTGRSLPDTDEMTVEIPTSMESCDSIVFHQAILIPAGDPDVVPLPPSDLDLSAYVSYVLFNLALAHHLQGGEITHCMEQQEKAEALYSLVIDLLEDDAALAVHHLALIVKLACINNLSQIRYTNGEFNKARQGLTQVSSWFRRQPLANQARIEEDSTVQGLLVSVLMLKAPVVAKAA